MLNMTNQRGFTLVEIVISILLLGIIVAGASNILIQGTRAIRSERKILDADWQGRVALERMTRDLHAIRSKIDILTATNNQFSFVDIDGETINYYVSNNKLMRNGQSLADGVHSITFSYYDHNGIITAQISSICYITINIHITYDDTNFYFEIAVFPWGLS